MSFIFRIESATHLPTVGAYLLDGTLKMGKVLSGDNAHIRELDVQVRIKTVALVNDRNMAANHFTLDIELPCFPLSQIQGGMTLEG